MKINYDPKAKAMYIELAKGKYEVSEELSDSVIIDVDKKGKVLGIEILDVSNKELGMRLKKDNKLSIRVSAIAHKISK